MIRYFEWRVPKYGLFERERGTDDGVSLSFPVVSAVQGFEFRASIPLDFRIHFTLGLLLK